MEGGGCLVSLGSSPVKVHVEQSERSFEIREIRRRVPRMALADSE